MENSYTVEDVKYLRQYIFVSPSDLWKKAFDEYNNDPKNSKKSMGCRSCYRIVYLYLFHKHNFEKLLSNGD